MTDSSHDNMFYDQECRLMVLEIRVRNIEKHLFGEIPDAQLLYEKEQDND